MAARSTRQKIKDQAGKMVNSCSDIALHLKNLSDLADGQSQIITAHIPLILSLQDQFLKIILEFRDKL